MNKLIMQVTPHASTCNTENKKREEMSYFSLLVKHFSLLTEKETHMLSKDISLSITYTLCRKLGES
jgi:hypothetical protein